MISAEERAEIRARAREHAATAPELTDEQKVRIRALFRTSAPAPKNADAPSDPAA